MDIVKKRINNYDVYVNNIKDYKKLGISLVFEMGYCKLNKVICNILDRYLSECFRNRETEFEELGLEHYYFFIDKLGKEIRFQLNLTLKEVIDFQHVLEFIKDLLTLDVEDGKLMEENLKKSKDFIVYLWQENHDKFHFGSKDSLTKFLFPNTYLTDDIFDTAEELRNYLGSISDEEIIGLYKQIIDESFQGIILVGDIKNEYLEVLGNYLLFKKTKNFVIKDKKDLFISEDGSSYIKVEDENYDESESVLSIVYNCPANSNYDKLLYYLISRMLGEKDAKEKSYFVYDSETNSLITKVFLNGKSEEEALHYLEKELESLNDDALIEELLDKVEALHKEFDWNDQYCINVLIETMIEIFGYNKIDKEYKKGIPASDIKNALGKLKRVKVHYYEGTKK